MSADYCEMCDLPLSQCIHGMPAPAPEPKVAPRKASPVVRRTSAARTSTPPAPARRVVRRWTPPEAFAPHILAVLQDAGGELDTDAFFARLEERLGEEMLAGDREKTPEGELRWRYAARRARQALINEGLMAKGRPGVWELTSAGRLA